MFGSFRVWIAVPRTMPRPATPPPPKHVQETYALRGSSRPRANASSNPETEISCCLWVWMLSRVREQDPRNCWNFAVARLFAVGQKLFSIRWLVDLFFSKRRLVAFYWIVARRDGFVKTLRCEDDRGELQGFLTFVSDKIRSSELNIKERRKCH